MLKKKYLRVILVLALVVAMCEGLLSFGPKDHTPEEEIASTICHDIDAFSQYINDTLQPAILSRSSQNWQAYFLEARKHYKKIEEAIDELRADGYAIYSVEQARNSIPLNEFPATANTHEKIAVILGNEVTGVEQSTIALSDGCIEIPQLGMKHSLNVSVAAGVVLWELVRTRISE